ncbi:MAG: hypothetical protein ACOWWH_08665 [Eubacteriaceae bacterium]
MNSDLSIIPYWVWTLLAVILLIQGTWIFNDANKRGMNRWLWGLLGLLNTPTNLIVYLIVSRTILGTRRCYVCDMRYNKTYQYCPHCGELNKED